LTLAIVQRQDEVKEIALAKVAGRLLLKVSPSNSEAKHPDAYI